MQISITETLKKKFIGVDDLRRDLSDILENLPKGRHEIIITQHGQPKAILVDLNTYLQLIDIQEDIIQPGFISSLYKELALVKKGKGTSHEELVKELELDV